MFTERLLLSYRRAEWEGPLWLVGNSYLVQGPASDRRFGCHQDALPTRDGSP